MKTYLIFLAFSLLFTAAVSLPLNAQDTSALLASCCAEGGKCVGSANCKACSTCEYCKYCNSGGSCGVCATGTGVNSYSPWSIPVPPPYYPTQHPIGNGNPTHAVSHDPPAPPPDANDTAETGIDSRTAMLEEELTRGFENQHQSAGIQTKRFYNVKNGIKEYATFSGLLVEEKPEGYGYLQYDNGDWFKGRYQNGNRCGTGISYFASEKKKVIREYPACW